MSCKICQKEFIKNHNQKCCSPECSKINLKQLRKLWYKTEKGKLQKKREMKRYSNTWLRLYKNTQDRCENPRHPAYLKYSLQGIKLLLSREEWRDLYYEQGADKMLNPSPHRPDIKKGYQIGNLIFMELKDHLKILKHRRKLC